MKVNGVLSYFCPFQSRQIKESELSKEESRALSFLSDESNQRVNGKSQSAVKNFLLTAKKDQNLRKRIEGHYKVTGKTCPDHLKKLLDAVYKFGYKTQDSTVNNKMVTTANTALNNLHTYLANSKAKMETLTQKHEVRQLESFANMNELFLLLEERGLNYSEDAQLGSIVKTAKTAKEWNDKLLTQLESDNRYKSGQLVSYTMENNEKYLGKAPMWIERFWFKYILGGDSTHIGVQVKNPDTNETFTSHASDKYKYERKTIGSYGNDTYAVNFESAIDNEEHRKLIVEAYANEKGYENLSWKEIFQKVQTEEMAQWHKDKKDWLKGARNPKGLRPLVALLFNTISLFSRTWRERMQFQDEFLKKNNQVTCGEFTIKTTLQVLDRTAARMAEKINTKYRKSFKSETLIGQKISPHRRIRRYHPSYFLKRAVDQGFITKVEGRPAIFNALIQA